MLPRRKKKQQITKPPRLNNSATAGYAKNESHVTLFYQRTDAG